MLRLSLVPRLFELFAWPFSMLRHEPAKKGGLLPYGLVPHCAPESSQGGGEQLGSRAAGPMMLMGPTYWGHCGPWLLGGVEGLGRGFLWGPDSG